MKSKSSHLQKLRTEGRNRASADLDTKSAIEVARTINREDAKVAQAIKEALPQIARAIDMIAAQLKRGGRLIYVGAGTSGRIAALDAAECPPTFNTDPGTVQFVMAGGTRALGAAVEANEDSRELGRKDISARRPGPRDAVVGIAASGRTPYTVAAVEYARAKRAKTIALTCNPNSPLEKAAGLAIIVNVGPEVVSGSSRMKAGTAQKMVLNMLSTGAMARLGRVYGNLMVNVHVKNQKLRERALSILMQASGESRAAVSKALKEARDSVPIALVMLQSGLNRGQAEQQLEAAKGHVRQGITRAIQVASKSANRQKRK